MGLTLSIKPRKGTPFLVMSKTKFFPILLSSVAFWALGTSAAEMLDEKQVGNDGPFTTSTLPPTSSPRPSPSPSPKPKTGRVCPRTSTFCMHANQKQDFTYLDCDGDGIPDPLCTSHQNDEPPQLFKFLSSKYDCDYVEAAACIYKLPA